MSSVPFERYNQDIYQKMTVINRLNTVISETTASEYGSDKTGQVLIQDNGAGVAAFWRMVTTNHSFGFGVNGGAFSFYDNGSTNSFNINQILTASLQLIGAAQVGTIAITTLVGPGGASTALIPRAITTELNQPATTFTGGSMTLSFAMNTGFAPVANNVTMVGANLGATGIQLWRRMGIDGTLVANDAIVVQSAGTLGAGTGTLTVFIDYEKVTLA